MGRKEVQVELTTEQLDQALGELSTIKKAVDRIERVISPDGPSCYLSQREGAEALGVSRHTLMRWAVPSTVRGRARMYAWEDLSMAFKLRRGHRPQSQGKILQMEVASNGDMDRVDRDDDAGSE